MALSVVLVLVVVAAGVSGLDNGLGRTPGMGWNSDYCVNCSGTSANGFQNEHFIKYLASYINSSGLQALGYSYVNMDSKWDLDKRDASGNVVPDPAIWPSGIENTIDYVHALGLGFGVYGDRGTLDCAGDPGNLGHEVADAKFYASIGVDWYKSDSCHASGDQATALKEYATMRDALNATGRPIWFALCGWNPWYAPTGHSIANSWRIGPDTVCGWGCIIKNVASALSGIAKYTAPGGWNDMCLLLTPHWGKPGSADYVTPERHRTQFNLWSVMAANLLMTGNLSALDPYALETWSNPEVIAINQDLLGLPYAELNHTAVGPAAESRLAYQKAGLQECGGEPDNQVWAYNAPASQFLSNAATKLCLNVAECKTEIIFDGCVDTGATCAGQGKYDNEQWVFNNSRVYSALSSTECVTNVDNALVLKPCDPSDSNQIWSYTAQKQIRSQSGLCVTTQSAPTSLTNSTLVIGRPVANNTHGVVFFNNSPNEQQVVCGPACFAAMGYTAGQTLTVRDLWKHAAIGTVSAGAAYSVTVPGGGASVFLSFRPA